MSPPRKNRWVALMIGAAPFAACSTTRQIETTPKADVMVLSSTYAVTENLGPAPIQVTSNENLARYKLERKKKAPEYLLVLFPSKMKGSLPVKLAEGPGAAGETTIFGSYFDQLLRAHRLVLRGDLEEASGLIQRMQNQYDDGFGTSILAGNIALLKGDHATASRRFSYAQSLIPGAPVPKDFLPAKSAGEGP